MAQIEQLLVAEKDSKNLYKAMP